MVLINNYIQTLEHEFKCNSNAKIAAGQKAYMRDQFEFFGIKTPKRRTLQKPLLANEYLPPKSELETIVTILWNKPEREFQLFAQELVSKYTRVFEIKDLSLLEYMVTHKSWWDTVDYIAAKLMSAYFKLYPSLIDSAIEKWLSSGNIWLQRCCILYQLKSKDKIDIKRLEYIIKKLLGSKEFFINKAIGWVLREYSKTNPNWVINFVAKNNLTPLSKREALRLLS
ncbi:DNA alkylation repair protein [Maribacter sp. CXY002]|uniref:DNA alkylation repair protein n=1 Tax=Maribacter luteocoastalis TaxID=3407671 RepID=UPI003B67E035